MEYDEFCAEEAEDDRGKAASSAKRAKKSRPRERLVRLMKKFGKILPPKRELEDTMIL